MTPRPTLTRYNDWRQVEVAAPEAFTPILPVSVVIPYYNAPEALALLLASLEGQSYPRDLFEVIVVDDGSPTPLERPRSTPLDVKVVRQDRRGFGQTRARNAGSRAAAGDILVFFDGDVMAEAGCLAAHARWHHAVSDALTVGFRAHVQVDGLDADAIRRRPGSLEALFADRPVEPPWVEQHMRATGDLTSKDDDPFRLVVGANFGVGRDFYALVGGAEESFTEWVPDDVELGYRIYTRGGLLVPARDALVWHQGLEKDIWEGKRKRGEPQYAKLAHLVAHPRFRRALPGRTFTVPQYVVTIEREGLSADRVFEVIAKVLADRMHDLVVRVGMREGDDGFAWLQQQFDTDPRVRVGPAGSALDEFPVSPFHVTLPASAPFTVNLVHRLRSALGAAVTASSTLPGGATVSITRAWALHRARRTGRNAADFGDAVTVSPRKLGLVSHGRTGIMGKAVRTTSWNERSVPERLGAHIRNAHGPGDAWWILTWLARGSATRTARWLRRHRGTLAALRKASYPLGVEVAALGPVSRAVFAASRRVATTVKRPRLDVAAADTALHAANLEIPSVVLSEAPHRLSTPAFDPLTSNPVGWMRNVGHTVGALGPLDRLPPGIEADRVIRSGDRHRLRQLHHLEDVQAFHPDATARAGALARLAALGVVAHLADDDRRLEPLLGAELYGLMTGDVRDIGLAARERLSIRMRRAALREHSLCSRARQLCAQALPDPPPLPLVSILLATRRPERLPSALAAVARQTYPRLELVLALHGEGFVDVERSVDSLACPKQVVRVDARRPLGSVLNMAATAASGTLLTKMDDDDLYGADHVWDLVLAHEYSQAQVVGKGAEFVYLAPSDRTLHCFSGGGETYTHYIAGGALLIASEDLHRLGGWRRIPQGVDEALIKDVARAGGQVYRTHGAGFMLVRHGRRHTWGISDDYFLTLADRVSPGWDPALADLGDLDLPHPALDRAACPASAIPPDAGS